MGVGRNEQESVPGVMTQGFHGRGINRVPENRGQGTGLAGYSLGVRRALPNSRDAAQSSCAFRSFANMRVHGAFPELCDTVQQLRFCLLRNEGRRRPWWETWRRQRTSQHSKHSQQNEGRWSVIAQQRVVPTPTNITNSNISPNLLTNPTPTPTP